MSDSIIQILNSEGQIVEGQAVPEIEEDDVLKVYRTMLLNRRVDERMIKLQRQGRIGFYIGSIGEEASIVASALALNDSDWIVPCYRELGAALLRGYPLYDFFCQLYGNAEDKMHGRQMPNHYAISSLNFTSISSPVGTQISQAAGIAMGMKIKKSNDIVLVYFGDGATSQGDFHVACNFAGVYQAPVIFFCRNNQWAISVPLEKQTASETLAVKAKAYGIHSARVDGNDVFGVYEVTRQAAERARNGNGPTLIEALTYRQGAHSTSDDPRAYREESEVEEWKHQDPLIRLKKYLIGRELWTDAEDEKLEETIKEQIQSTLKKVEKIGPPPVETMFEDVYDTPPWHLREQQEELEEIESPEPQLA